MILLDERHARFCTENAVILKGSWAHKRFYWDGMDVLLRVYGDAFSSSKKSFSERNDSYDSVWDVGCHSRFLTSMWGLGVQILTDLGRVSLILFR